MKRFFIAAIAVVALSLTSVSCLKNTYEKYSWSRVLVGTLTNTNSVTGDIYTNNEQQVMMEMPDAFTNVMNLYLLNIKFVEAMPALASIELGNLRFEVSTREDMPANTWIINEPSLVPTINGVPYENYTMTSFYCTVTDNRLELSFRINVGNTPYMVHYISNPVGNESED